ncbi:MAG: cupin domain-containing protein [Planctomycetota bacterium]|jgi:quercetin dioxygenase-like cupin family protein
MAELPSIDSPTNLADLVEYQDGSIVSRALVKDKSGTVTVFAFAAGEGLSEHETPYDALLCVLDGSANVVIGGEPHTLTAGRIIRLPANVPHSVQAEQRFKMLLIMIRSGK